eukprot:405900_1
MNYHIWMDMKDRTKIDEVVYEDHAIISKVDAEKLSKNLDITDDQKINQTQVVTYFIGKSKYRIKLDILLNPDAIDCITSIFKSVKYVQIQNIECICSSLIDKFMNFVFEKIPLIEQD